MMENRNWREGKSSELIDLISGFAFKSANFLSENRENTLPIIKIKNVANGDVNLNDVVYHEYNDKLSNYVIEKGDVLIAMTGNHIHAQTQIVGDVSLCKLDDPILLNQRVGKFVAKNDADLKFAYYLFKDEETRFNLANKASGSANQANVSKTDILDLDILIPPLPEQKAIASVLSSLDDKIDLLHQQNQTLEALAETLFRQWFIEEAKEEWEELPFSEWINETVGGDWGKETLQDEFTKEVYWIRGTDIADLLIGIPTKTPIRFVKEKKFQSIEPKEGDIIIEISGGTENQSTGRAYFINNEIKSLFGKDLVFSNFCRLIRIKDSNYSFFVYLYLKYLYDQD